MLQALGSSSSNNGSDGPPLSGHQLGQMQQLLLFLSGPFCLLDAGVQPLVPAHRQKVFSLHPAHLAFFLFSFAMEYKYQHLPSGFTLFGRFAVQQ